MTRPRSLKAWASDDVFNAPGKSWDQTPTKIEPNDTLVAQGWHPGMAPPAQVENYLRAEERAMVRYLSAIEVQNWCRYDIAKPDYTHGNRAIAYDPSNAATYFVANGGTGTHYSRLFASLSGEQFIEHPWQPTGIATTTFFRAVAAANGYVALAIDWHSNPLSARPVFAYALDETTQDVVDPLDVGMYGRAKHVLWHPASQSFIAIAFASGTDDMEETGLVVYRYNVATRTNQKVFSTPTIFELTHIDQIGNLDAFGVLIGNDVVLFAKGGATKTIKIYRLAWNPDTASFTDSELAHDLPAGFELAGADYSTVDNVFALVGRNAGNVEVRTSTLGDVWELAATLGDTGSPDGIAIKGSLYVVHYNWRVWYSLDLAQTWDFIPSPLERGTDSFGPHLLNLGDRFALVHSRVKPGDAFRTPQIAYSLRLK